MSVVIETTVGDITVDLFLNDRPRACLNFMKLCKIKYYNYNLFHTISRGFMAQTGDPTGSRTGGESIFGILDGPTKRYFEGENEPRIKHTKMGLISFVGNDDRMIGSQFFLTLGEDLTYLDEKHCVFGEVVEGFDVLEMINEVICDTDDRPYQDVRVTHTVILDDPFPDPKKLVVPSRSPSPSVERLQGGRIAPDEEIDELEGKTSEEVVEMQADREAKARATILEMVGDLPDAEMAPPENVLFVCKLNPVTNDDDLEIIFSRFGKIKSCEVIRDKKTGDSLQYAFVEFETQKSCEDAYFKMDNVLIDDRRIHVDFSQSVSKVKWHGKGRGVTHYDEKGQKSRYNNNNNIGKGDYKNKNDFSKNRNDSDKFKRRSRDRDNLTPPRRNRDFISPKRNEPKKDRDRRSSRERESNSRKHRERSSSPRKRETSSRNYRESHSSSRRNVYESRTDKDGKKMFDNRSNDSGKRGTRHDTSTNRSRDDHRVYEKERRIEKRYAEERKEKEVKKKQKKRSYSDSDNDSKRHKEKKKSKYSSEDSDSDREKKTSKKKVSSDSSDSEYKTKKKNKKSSRKDSSDSDSNSDHHKSKLKKKKKKKKRHNSDSD